MRPLPRPPVSYRGCILGYGFRTVRLTLVENDYWAQVRTSLTLNEVESLPDVPARGTVPEKEYDEAARVRRNHFLATAITAWNVDGPDGAVLPITPETVRLLTVPDSNAVMDITNGKRPAEDQFTFTPTSTHGSAAPEVIPPQD